ncbi:hypothetical protein RISK_001621 [Rhodopirellula islandica]|uniref:Uncharacterized protein n=1 Tax=Rhodopirellula islandica TaxID=595434 RepID=A0A0J1BIP8_RHOIS|nr:hypothetical protein RISK_001621 [Rhodopirellula islandica]
MRALFARAFFVVLPSERINGENRRRFPSRAISLPIFG